MAGDADDVLDRDRHAAERQVHVGRVRLPAGVFEIGGKIPAERRVHRLDAVGESIERLARGELAAAQTLLEAGGGLKK